MADTWITDMRHFLDEDGVLPEGLPAPALKLVLYQGAIVAWVAATGCRSGQTTRTNVNCRRNPGRRPCGGEIVACHEAASSTIVWECPLCGDRGRISGWEGTDWDRRVPDA